MNQSQSCDIDRLYETDYADKIVLHLETTEFYQGPEPTWASQNVQFGYKFMKNGQWTNWFIVWIDVGGEKITETPVLKFYDGDMVYGEEDGGKMIWRP